MDGNAAQPVEPAPPAGNRDVEREWRRTLERLCIPDARFQAQMPGRVSRRVYVHDGLAYKIWRLRGKHLGREPYRHEYHVLHACHGIPGVVQVVDRVHHHDLEVIVFRHFHGIQLDELEPAWGRTIRVLGRVAMTLLRLSTRGIAHNDVTAHNILVGPDTGHVLLIDFDQANKTSRAAALYRNFWRTGTRDDPGAAFKALAFRRLEALLPDRLASGLRWLTGRRRLEPSLERPASTGEADRGE